MKTILSLLIVIFLTTSISAQNRYKREEPLLPNGQAALPWMQHPNDALSYDTSWYDGFGIQSLNGTVFCISDWLITGDPSYAVGGAFTRIGSTSASRVAVFNEWDRSLSAATSDSIDGVVYAMAASDKYLYVGGNFTTARGAHNLARLDLDKFGDWQPVGAGTDSTVLALAVYEDSLLYVGGNFQRAGNITAHYLARYNLASESWQQIVIDGAEGADGGVTALLQMDDRYSALVIGGAFRHLGNRAANCVAALVDTGCMTMGNGIDDPNGVVECLAYSRMYYEGLFAGGHFASADGSPTSNLASWTTLSRAWKPTSYLGNTHGTVYALSYGLSLAIGGDFVKDGADSGYLRFVDPRFANMPHGLSRPPNGPVYALRDESINWMEGVTQKLYIGGDFQTIAGHTSPFLAAYRFEEDVQTAQLPGFRIRVDRFDSRTLILRTQTSESLGIEWIDITGRVCARERFTADPEGTRVTTPATPGLYLLTVRSPSGASTFKISVP
jgi:hypothetical protein